MPPLLAMLLVCLGLAVPSRAAGDEGILLRGSRTAYVDLTVYVNTTIDPSAIRVTRHGSFAGFFLSPAPANRDTVGALVMPRVGATGDGTLMRLGESWDVAAGRYRAFLLADGPAEVFIPIAGQGYRGHVPTGRAPLSVRRADFDVAAGSTGTAHRTLLKLTSRALVVAAGAASSDSLTAVERLDACVTKDADCATTFQVDARVPAADAWTYAASLVPRGNYAGILDVTRLAGLDAPSHISANVLVLTIGVQS
ncbi:MAG TPA: hypothetical protein VFQ85_06215 [Mycobacteriales bacterium]|nr:hypothetical protein [Mycobacteriales bacterium]